MQSLATPILVLGGGRKPDVLIFSHKHSDKGGRAIELVVHNGGGVSVEHPQPNQRTLIV